MDRAPREPRRGPRERPAPAELHHGGLATDRRHRALVLVLERLDLLLLQDPRDRRAGVLAGLQRHRPELREDGLGLGVGDPRDVADAEHLGVTGDREVGSDRDPVAVLQLETQAGYERVGLQPGPPDQRVGVQHGAGLQPDPCRLDALDHLAEHDLDRALLERLLRVGLQALLEHRQDGVPGLDHDDPSLVLRDVGVVLRQVLPVQLGERAGALDPGRAGADDDDVERAVVDQVRVAVRRRPAFEHVVLQAHGVGQRVHRERVLGGAGDPEEIHGRPEPEHEVVVRDGPHLGERHLALVQVDPGDRRLLHLDVRMVVEQVAERMADRGRLEEVGRDLVQERLERVVVVLVDDEDVGGCILQLLGRSDACEPAAQDQDLRSIGHRCLPSRVVEGSIYPQAAPRARARVAARRTDPHARSIPPRGRIPFGLGRSGRSH